MKLSTDHVFHIGHQHLRNGEPCQDFALSGVHPRGAYAIVSDGCSTGGQTDVGARVIALSTRQHIVDPWHAPSFAQAQMLLGLADEDLLATCLFISINPQGETLIQVLGDGVVATVARDGTLYATRFEWAQNMPCYPVYKSDNFARFIAAQGGDLNAGAFTWEQWGGRPGESLTLVGAGECSLGTSLQGYTIGLHAETFDYLAVFSDGVQQVEGKPWYDVVRELLAFKTGAGGFARRRMQRFLSDAGKLGRGPQDDIAYAVIRIEHEEVNSGEA